MKKSEENLEHQIQLKRDEITNYLNFTENYPKDRESTKLRFLEKLQTELSYLENELIKRNKHV